MWLSPSSSASTEPWSFGQALLSCSAASNTAMWSVKHCALLSKGPASFCITGSLKISRCVRTHHCCSCGQAHRDAAPSKPWETGAVGLCSAGYSASHPASPGAASVKGTRRADEQQQGCKPVPWQALTAVQWSGCNQPKIHFQLVAAEVFMSICSLRKNVSLFLLY